MNNEAFSKIYQTHELFKKIVEPLKTNFGISFGYMIVFKDASYYQIIEDLECLNKWVTNVEASSIFCMRSPSAKTLETLRNKALRVFFIVKSTRKCYKYGINLMDLRKNANRQSC